MMEYKVLLIDDAHNSLVEDMRVEGIVLTDARTWDRPEVKNRLSDYDGLIMKSSIRIDEAILSSAPRLKVIGRLGVGLDHIDLDACARQGVKVLTSPEGSRDTVAEHTIGMLLMLMNNLAKADTEVRNGIWKRAENRGVEIKNKTVGIVGYGNMGQQVARRLSSFGCRIITYDKHKKDYGDQYAEAVSLQTLKENADIVSFHVPLDAENLLFVNENYLSEFKKPIFLVNTARGKILKTSNLVDFLKDGRVIGAALDVLEYEEQSFDKFSFDNLPEDFQYLRSSPRVVLSPHIAGWSFESYEGHSRVIAEKVKAFFSDISMVNH